LGSEGTFFKHRKYQATNTTINAVAEINNSWTKLWLNNKSMVHKNKSVFKCLLNFTGLMFANGFLNDVSSSCCQKKHTFRIREK